MCSTGEHREEQVRSDIGLHHAICSYIRTKLARFWVRTAQNHGLPADFSAADRVPMAAFCTFYRGFEVPDGIVGQLDNAKTSKK